MSNQITRTMLGTMIIVTCVLTFMNTIFIFGNSLELDQIHEHIIGKDITEIDYEGEEIEEDEEPVVEDIEGDDTYDEEDIGKSIYRTEGSSALYTYFSNSDRFICRGIERGNTPKTIEINYYFDDESYKAELKDPKVICEEDIFDDKKIYTLYIYEYDEKTHKYGDHKFIFCNNEVLGKENFYVTTEEHVNYGWNDHFVVLYDIRVTKAE